jgi:hypothetical protein
MRRRTIVLIVLVPLVAFVWAGADHMVHRWSWKHADLDRNRLTLAYYHGAESGERLAEWIEHGDVVTASGVSLRTQGGGDAEVVVRYTREVGGWLAGATTTTETDCYRFTFPEYDIDFDRVTCPLAKSFGTALRHAEK